MGAAAPWCGNSPFVGRYLWAMEGCEIGTTTPISPSTCQARLEGDVREGCYMSVDGTSIHLTCDGEYWGRISTQQVPGCPGYFFFIEDGYINFFSDQPWPGYRQCQDSPEFNNSCAECQDSPEFNSSCAE